MALTESLMLPLGTNVPGFSLPNVLDNTTQQLDNLTGEKGTIIVFMCNHCPYVVHILKHFVSFAQQFKPLGIHTIAISSNDIDNYPADHPDLMKQLAIEKEFSFPYLFDEDQSIAQAYKAACTPDFYLINADKELVYRGRYDQSRPGNDLPVTGKDLQTAVDLLINNQSIPSKQYPSLGCGIKWKAKNSPSGFFN